MGYIEELRLTAALGAFWLVRGYLSEGWGRLLGAIERAKEDGPPLLQAKSLHGAGVLAQDRSC